MPRIERVAFKTERLAIADFTYRGGYFSTLPYEKAREAFTLRVPFR
jgi:hypothetical protein